MHDLIELIRHLDQHINGLATQMGPWFYVLLFAIVFCETGLVVMPFLPGDSLLFAVGALAASDKSPISLPLAMLVLCVAANLGDIVNYSIGTRLGPAVFKREKSFLLNKKHLERAQGFYDKHGRATIILARFVPVIRTFAPFVAGVGRMPFSRFILFSIGGGVLWVVSLSLAGYYLNSYPLIHDHFEMVIVAIVFISILPAIIHVLQARRAARRFEELQKSDS